MSKPNLVMYVGQKVIAITRGKLPWEWGIKFANGVEIRNKARNETFRPIGLVNRHLLTISFSVQDTTLHFSGEEKVSLKPTAYSIADPRHGGEVYPQWPEELETVGIPSHPEEDVSAQPSEEWAEVENEIHAQADTRRQGEAANFLAETEEQ